MFTSQLPNAAPASFDGAIVHAVHSLVETAPLLEDERENTDTPRYSLIAVRNESGQIYREIGLATVREYLRVMRAMRALGLREEAGGPLKEGYDAILGPDAVRPAWRALSVAGRAPFF